MMKRAALLLALIACPMILDAQLCAVPVRFALRGVSSLTGTLDTMEKKGGPIMPTELSATYRFEILDADRNPISGASLSVTPDSGRLSSVHEVAPGSVDVTIAGSAGARVVVSAVGFRSDTIALGENPGGSRVFGSIVVQLARPGDRYEYRNGRKFAYTRRPDMIALLVNSRDTAISRLLDSLGVEAIDHGHPPFFVGRTRRPLDGMNDPVLAAIRRAPGGAEAGPIRSLSNDRIIVFSDRIRITCRDGFDPRRSDLLRRMPSIGSIGPVGGGGEYVVRVAPGVGDGIIEIARDLPKIDGIISASIEYITPPRVIH
jgi:hypothetical protein